MVRYIVGIAYPCNIVWCAICNIIVSNAAECHGAGIKNGHDNISGIVSQPVDFKVLPCKVEFGQNGTGHVVGNVCVSDGIFCVLHEIFIINRHKK